MHNGLAIAIGCQSAGGGGGGSVTLADLQAVYSSFDNGVGFLRDFRLSDGLWQDVSETAPVATSGDVVGKAYNQSGMPGADALSLTETSSSAKPLFYVGEGLYSIGRDDLDNSGINPGCLTGECTQIIVGKFAAFGGTGVHGRMSTSLNYFNFMFYDISGVRNVRIYIGSSSFAGNYPITPDENGIMVCMAQRDLATDRCYVYCNNVEVGWFDVSLTNWSKSFSVEITGIEMPGADDRFIGAATVPGLLDADQRQLFCDYFQQNGGVIS